MAKTRLYRGGRVNFNGQERIIECVEQLQNAKFERRIWFFGYENDEVKHHLEQDVLANSEGNENE